MKRLLWKELREKRAWMLALLASTVGVMVFGDPLHFLGPTGSPRSLMPFLVAMLSGAGAYSTELAGGAADFVRSRAIDWKRLLVAKLIAGACIVAATSIVSALAFRLICPEQYLRFAGPMGLLNGAWYGFKFIGSAYLVGFACSVVGRGTAGGMLTVIVLYFSVVAEVLFNQWRHIHPSTYWSVYLRLVGALVATTIISRFGLTLPPGWRLARFASIVAIFTLVGIPLDFLVKYGPPESRPFVSRTYSVSPDGRYVAKQVGPKGSLVRLSDGRRVPTDWPDATLAVEPNLWSGDTFLAMENSSPTALWMGRMDARGRVRHTRIPVDSLSALRTNLAPSPSGRIVMVGSSAKAGGNQALMFVNPATLRPLKQRVESGVQDYWWKSDSEAIYLDSRGRPREIHVEN